MTDLSIEPIARHLLGDPNPRLSSKTELRYGARGSLSIDLAKNVWRDHEANVGGGVLDFVQRHVGLTEQGACWDWLREQGFAEASAPFTNGKTAPRACIVATYDYEDEVGKLLFQVVRFDPKDFKQRRPDPANPGKWIWGVRGVRQVPYRLPEIIERRESPIFICEGEKDCDRLWALGIPATTNAGGAGKWRSELCEHFNGADVIIIPDRDPQKRHPKTGELMFHEDGRPVLPGQDHAADVAAQLSAVAERVRVLELWRHWPDMPEKGDVSDWLRAGNTAEELWTLARLTPDWSKAAAFNALIDTIAPLPREQEPLLPRRAWLVPGLLMRKQVTVLVAPSGSGKSLLTLQVGIACAQGEKWAGWKPRGHLRVLVINSEDDVEEMQRRLMAATYRMNSERGFDWESYLQNFRMIDGTKSGVIVAKFDVRSKTLVAQPLVDQLIATINAGNYDVVFVDPFAETFEGDENSNSELKWAGMLWRDVARKTNAAICIVHHTKKYASGMAGDVDAARGAGALIGIARIVSTLFPMTSKEAEAMGVKFDQRALYLRYDDAKANLNIVSPHARWFRKDTVVLDNADGPDNPGDEVGVLIPWKPKGPSVLEQQIIAFFERVDRGICDDAGVPSGEYYTFKKGRSGERYIGHFAQEFFHLDALSQAEGLVEGWRKAKRLQETQYKSPRNRHVHARVISELSPDCPKNKQAAAAPKEEQEAML